MEAAMRTHSSSPEAVRGNGILGARRLDEIFDSIIVMRWYLKEALHEAADVPEAAAESLTKVLKELDISIAAMKTVAERRGWSSQERRNA